VPPDAATVPPPPAAVVTDGDLPPAGLSLNEATIVLRNVIQYLTLGHYAVATALYDLGKECAASGHHGRALELYIQASTAYQQTVTGLTPRMVSFREPCGFAAVPLLKRILTSMAHAYKALGQHDEAFAAMEKASAC